MRRAFKVEVQPTPTQLKALLQHAGNARWAYNWGLAQHQAAHAAWVAEGKPAKWDGWRTAIDLHKDLNALKKADPENGGVPWMYEASKCAPQEALRDLDRAFKNFLEGRAKYPRFKSKSRGIGGFQLTGTIQVAQKTVQLPRIGRLRVKPGDHGYLPWGRHSAVCVTERAGRWFVSIVGPQIADAANKGLPAVGLDLGVARLATLSDGTVIENPKALAAGRRKLDRLQREVARKKKISSNRRKARTKVAKAYARVAKVRSDALHKATTTLAKSHGRIVIEDLRVKNMTAGGGKKKRGLNRVLLDASLGEFRRQLEYKGKLYGCEVVAVAAQYTSQRCSLCGHTDRGNRPSQAGFCCLSCGFEINADLNAAINILVAGSCPETENACGAGVRRGGPRVTSQPAVKQESAVAR